MLFGAAEMLTTEQASYSFTLDVCIEIEEDVCRRSLQGTCMHCTCTYLFDFDVVI